MTNKDNTITGEDMEKAYQALKNAEYKQEPFAVDYVIVAGLIRLAKLEEFKVLSEVFKTCTKEEAIAFMEKRINMLTMLPE